MTKCHSKSSRQMQNSSKRLMIWPTSDQSNRLVLSDYTHQCHFSWYVYSAQTGLPSSFLSSAYVCQGGLFLGIWYAGGIDFRHFLMPSLPIFGIILGLRETTKQTIKYARVFIEWLTTGKSPQWPNCHKKW